MEKDKEKDPKDVPKEQEPPFSSFPTQYTITQKTLVWKFPKKLGSYTLHGASWSCHQTAFQIPELGWNLDCGFVPSNERRSSVFITHAHGDHSSSLPFMISRHVPPVIYLPEEALEECRAYLESHLAFRLHGQEIEEMLPSYRLVGVRGGQKVRLTGKGHTDKLCEIFQCHHSVPCVGYGFLQEKKRLKAEYAGVPGRQLGALRKQGVALDEPFESPMFLFMGDTTVQFFEEQLELEGKGKENVFRYPLIITECTFLGLDEEDTNRAARKKHIVWTELKPIVVSHPHIVFVLIHFSLRHSPKELRSFFKDQKLDNIVVFVEEENSTLVQSHEQDQNLEDY